MSAIDARLLAFVLVAAVLIVAPGPDMALVSRNAIRFGARAVAPTVAGVATGILGWSAASALGVAALLERSASLFSVLRLAGAAYLVVLGVLALRSAAGGARAGSPTPGAAAAAAPRPRAATTFAQGLAGNLLNPKAGVIFLTLLPQFLRPGDPPLRVALMVALFEVMLVGWLLFYGRGLARIGGSRAGRRARRALEAVAGAVLVGLGARVAWESLRAG